MGAPFCLQSTGFGLSIVVELIVNTELIGSQSMISFSIVSVDKQGSVEWARESSSPSFTPPPSVSETFHRVHVMFSSQLSIPSLSKSPASSILVGSVSPGSTTPLPLRSSSPSSNWSPSVLLFLGSVA